MATGTGQSIRRSHFGEHDNPSETIQLTPVMTFDKLVTFSDVGAAAEFATTVICGLPIGDLLIIGGFLHLDVFESTPQGNIVDTYTVTVSLGTTPTADNNLTTPTTDQDLLIGAAASAAVAGVTPHIRRTLDGAAVLGGLSATADGYIDNNAGDKEVNLNLTLPDADITTGAGRVLRCKGTLQYAYVAFGKNA